MSNWCIGSQMFDISVKALNNAVLNSNKGVDTGGHSGYVPLFSKIQVPCLFAVHRVAVLTIDNQKVPLNCLGAIQSDQRGDLFGPRSKIFLSDLLLETPKEQDHNQGYLKVVAMANWPWALRLRGASRFPAYESNK